MSEPDGPDSGAGGSPFTDINPDDTPSVQTNTPDRHTSDSQSAAADSSNAPLAAALFQQEEQTEPTETPARQVTSEGEGAAAASNDGNSQTQTPLPTASIARSVATPQLSAEQASLDRLRMESDNFLDGTSDVGDTFSNAGELAGQQRNSSGAGPSFAAAQPESVQGTGSRDNVPATAARLSQPPTTGASQSVPSTLAEQTPRSSRRIDTPAPFGVAPEPAASQQRHASAAVPLVAAIGAPTLDRLQEAGEQRDAHRRDLAGMLIRLNTPGADRGAMELLREGLPPGSAPPSAPSSSKGSSRASSVRSVAPHRPSEPTSSSRPRSDHPPYRPPEVPTAPQPRSSQTPYRPSEVPTAAAAPAAAHRAAAADAVPPTVPSTRRGARTRSVSDAAADAAPALTPTITLPPSSADLEPSSLLSSSDGALERLGQVLGSAISGALQTSSSSQIPRGIRHCPTYPHPFAWATSPSGNAVIAFQISGSGAGISSIGNLVAATRLQDDVEHSRSVVLDGAKLLAGLSDQGRTLWLHDYIDVRREVIRKLIMAVCVVKSSADADSQAARHLWAAMSSLARMVYRSGDTGSRRWSLVGKAFHTFHSQEPPLSPTPLLDCLDNVYAPSTNMGAEEQYERALMNNFNFTTNDSLPSTVYSTALRNAAHRHPEDGVKRDQEALLRFRVWVNDAITKDPRLKLAFKPIVLLFEDLRRIRSSTSEEWSEQLTHMEGDHSDLRRLVEEVVSSRAPPLRVIRPPRVPEQQRAPGIQVAAVEQPAPSYEPTYGESAHDLHFDDAPPVYLPQIAAVNGAPAQIPADFVCPSLIKYDATWTAAYGCTDLGPEPDSKDRRPLLNLRRIYEQLGWKVPPHFLDDIHIGGDGCGACLARKILRWFVHPADRNYNKIEKPREPDCGYVHNIPRCRHVYAGIHMYCRRERDAGREVPAWMFEVKPLPPRA